MYSLKKIIAIGFLFYLPLQSSAWGVLGHRIVGQVAESYLTKHTKKEIAKILGHESIAMCANWGDFIKSDPAFGYLSSWHYVDMNGGLSEQEVLNYLATDSATDAYTKISFLTEQLKNKDLDKDKKVMYLRLLVHIVGDVHQPLHVGHVDDKGGNTIKVLWFNEHTNLHQVWDERLINFQQLSYTEYTNAINFATKDQVKELQNQPVSLWIAHTYALAQKVYADITEPEQRLDYKYNFNNLALLNEQLLEGGIHLAGLLNEIFD
ncbi:MAG: S1/P1 nuclease [Bacteroidetes bacterium]|nr:S1/P1 nuclease [Bacteroidota bacterium]MBS1757305.1 S1/P1 nuclease [Bacteroidota bacterium]